MTTKFYSVYAEVGGYAFSVAGDDQPNNAAATYGLADPLILSERWPDSNLAPNVQPEPMEATLNIIAPNSTTYSAMSVGDPVAVEFFSQAGLAGNGWKFYGRVATITAKPHDLGVIYTLGCVDYTVDYQGKTVGLVDWPAELIIDRVARACAEAGVPSIPVPSEDFGIFSSVAARDAGAISLYDAVVPLIQSLAVSTAGKTELGTPSVVGIPTYSSARRAVFKQFIGGGTRSLYPITPFYFENVVGVGRAFAYSPPLRFGAPGGLLSIGASAADSSPATGSFILDAGNVDMDTTFSQSKGAGLVSQVTVTTKSASHDPAVLSWDWANSGGQGVSTVFSPGPSIPVPTTNVTAELDTDLFDSPSIGQAVFPPLTKVLLPPNRPDPKAVYDVGTLVWQAWNEPANWVIPQLGQLLTVARVKPGKAPTNREWVVGVVSSRTLTVAGGRPTVAFETMQSTNDPRLNSAQLGATNGVARFDSPTPAGWTFATVSTRDTFIDYELVKG